jgi:putative ABC transport system permease protein
VLTLRLLFHLSVPQWRAHPVRTLVTIVGVALGVAAHVGIGNVNASVVASFRDTLRTVAGQSEIQIDPAAGMLAEADVARVAEVPGVAAAAGMIETFVPLAGEPGESLYLLGIDFLGSPVWEAQFPRSAIDIPDELAFVSRVDSVVVTRSFAEARDLAIGDPLAVVLPGDRRELRVRGLLADVSAARLFAGALAIMDLPAAALALGQEERVTRILVTLADGADRGQVRGRLAAVVGAAAHVSAPEARGEQAEKLLGSLRAMLATAGFLALLVGGFIVHHTVAVAVGERRRQFALANTVGIPRAALRRVCVLETLLVAVAGAALGVGLGRLLGMLAAPLAGGAASEIWLRVAVAPSTLGWADVVAGAGLGIAVALAACWFALRTSFAVPTIEALKPSGAATVDERVGRWTWAIGVGLLLSGGFLAFVPHGTDGTVLIALVDVAEGLPLLGAALVAPALVVVAGRGLHRLLRDSRNVPLELAAMQLPRSPVRGGSSVAMIAAALGIAVGLGILVESFQRAWVTWIENHFAADLFVGTGGRVRLMAGPPMAASVAEAVRGVPGVASVEPFRVLPLRLRGHDVFLQAIAVRERLAHGGLPMVEGSLAAVADALDAGTAVLVSDNLAYRLDLRVGDVLELPVPAGTRRVRIGGTCVDYLGSLDQGAVVVGSRALRVHWGDEAANLLRVWLRPGADPAGVRRAVLERLGAGSGYFVLTGRAFVDGVRDVLAQFFRAAWLLTVVAAVIGVIGIVNTQVAAILDRGRDHATLRTIGIPSAALARGVLVECGVLGALGGLLGAVVGGVFGVQVLTWTLRLLTGWRIPMHVPVEQIALAVMAATVVSALAGWVPARVATRLRIRAGGME